MLHRATLSLCRSVHLLLRFKSLSSIPCSGFYIYDSAPFIEIIFVDAFIGTFAGTDFRAQN